MDKKQLEILTNIIGGVESGGQVYGQRRYEAYAGKRANSANEKTCTLGWAQNYGNEARKLCQMILKEDPYSAVENTKAGDESETYSDGRRESGSRTVYGQTETESKVGISCVCPSER